MALKASGLRSRMALMAANRSSSRLPGGGESGWSGGVEKVGGVGREGGLRGGKRR